MKKIYEWRFWDWKSVIGGVIIAGGLLFGFYYLDALPDWMRSKHSKNYSAVTRAHFIKWQRISTAWQSRTGTSTHTDAFDITYLYAVNDSTFIEKDKVPNSTENQFFLQKLVHSGIPVFKIKYDPGSPAKSQIIIDTTAQ